MPACSTSWSKLASVTSRISDPAYSRPASARTRTSGTFQTASATIERPEELFGLSGRKATALVLDFDADVPGRDLGSQQDASVWTRELEGVAQQVPNCRRKQLPVAVHRDAELRRNDRESDPPRLRLHRGACLDIFDEFGQRHARTGMDVCATLALVRAISSSRCAEKLVQHPILGLGRIPDDGEHER